MTPMGKKRTKVTDQLRRAIETADKSRYALFQETGIDQATLSRFMHGKGSLSAEGIDLLAEALGLELVKRQSRSKKGG
jgi:transcriptional regulator with XRE-family HTH domain